MPWEHRTNLSQVRIECARKFFATLSENTNDNVSYDVVTNYSELMQLVME